MAYNKRVLKKATKNLSKKKTLAKPKDIIKDPEGQWKFPGQPTRIPGSDITMQGVPYPVLGVGSTGQKQMMYPNQEYQFPGSTYVDEFPPDKDAMNAMMKARLAYANEFGNPAAQRMITLPDNLYDFGDGNMGSHYMASMDNYAVPQIQDVNGKLVLGDFGPESNEAIRFDRPEDAEYFAEHYKDVSPAFIEAELTDEEIEEYKKGGYVIEEIGEDPPVYPLYYTEGLSKRINLRNLKSKYKKGQLVSNPEWENYLKNNLEPGLLERWEAEQTTPEENDLVQMAIQERKNIPMYLDQEHPEYAKYVYELLKSKYKKLDQGGFVELDLTPEEIQQYVDGGYVVEELPKAQDGKDLKNVYLKTKDTAKYPKLIRKKEKFFKGTDEYLKDFDTGKKAKYLDYDEEKTIKQNLKKQIKAYKKDFKELEKVDKIGSWYLKRIDPKYLNYTVGGLEDYGQYIDPYTRAYLMSKPDYKPEEEKTLNPYSILNTRQGYSAIRDAKNRGEISQGAWNRYLRYYGGRKFDPLRYDLTPEQQRRWEQEWGRPGEMTKFVTDYLDPLAKIIPAAAMTGALGPLAIEEAAGILSTPGKDLWKYGVTGVRNFLNTAPKGVPWASIGNTIGLGFGAEAAMNLPENIRKGNDAEAIVDAVMMATSPGMPNVLSKAYNFTKALTNPTTKALVNLPGKYTAGIKTPFGSEIYLGNTKNLTGAKEQILQKFTGPFSQASGTDIKIFKNVGKGADGSKELQVVSDAKTGYVPQLQLSGSTALGLPQYTSKIKYKANELGFDNARIQHASPIGIKGEPDPLFRQRADVDQTVLKPKEKGFDASEQTGSSSGGTGIYFSTPNDPYGEGFALSDGEGYIYESTIKPDAVIVSAEGMSKILNNTGYDSNVANISEEAYNILREKGVDIVVSNFDKGLNEFVVINPEAITELSQTAKTGVKKYQVTHADKGEQQKLLDFDTRAEAEAFVEKMGGKLNQKDFKGIGTGTYDLYQHPETGHVFGIREVRGDKEEILGPMKRKVPKSFESEIDWAMWNKDIPNNKPLMKEYLAIEESTKANGTWMKNPDGSVFKGTPEQFVQQQSQNFKNAFGESKLIGPEGSPMFLYHGSAKKFDTFDPSKFQLGDSGYSGRGIYTIPSKTTADSYALSSTKFHSGDIEPTVYELYGSAKNPISSEQLIKEGKNRRLFNFHRDANSVQGKLSPFESLQDYDAAVHNQLPNIERIKPWNDAWEIVFPKNTQLKSAVGNDGMFDMTNPNIYKSLLPLVGTAGAAAAAAASDDEDYSPGEIATAGLLGFITKGRLKGKGLSNLFKLSRFIGQTREGTLLTELSKTTKAPLNKIKQINAENIISKKVLPFDLAKINPEFQNKNYIPIYAEEAKASKTSNLPTQKIVDTYAADGDLVFLRPERIEKFKKYQDNLSKFALDFNTIWMEGNLSDNTKKLSKKLNKYLQEKEELERIGKPAFEEANEIRFASYQLINDYENAYWSGNAGYNPSEGLTKAQELIKQLEAEMELESTMSSERKKAYGDVIEILNKHINELAKDATRVLPKKGTINLMPDDSGLLTLLKDDANTFTSLRRLIAKARVDPDLVKLAKHYEDRNIPLNWDIEQEASKINTLDIVEPDVRQRIEALRDITDPVQASEDIIHALQTRGTLNKVNERGIKTSALVEGRAGDPSLEGTQLQGATQKTLDKIGGREGSMTAATLRSKPVYVDWFARKNPGTDDAIERIYEVWSKGENPQLEGYMNYTKNQYLEPAEVAGTVAHEDRHLYQELLGYLNPYFQYMEEYKYYVPKEGTKLGDMLSKVLIDPVKVDPLDSKVRHKRQSWLSSPIEVDSNLAKERLNFALTKFIKAKQANPNATQEELLKDIIKDMKLPENRKKFIEDLMSSPEGNVVQKHFLPEFRGAIDPVKDSTEVIAGKEFARQFLEMLPVLLIGLGLGSSMSGEGYKKGGSVDIELDEEQVQDYIRKGYILDEL